MRVGSSNQPYVTTKSYAYIESGNSVTASVYAQTGNIVLATVMYRDVNILGYPLGWTLLFDSDPTKNQSSLNHKFAFITLPITADGDVSATFTQTLNSRMIVHLITIKNVEKYNTTIIILNILKKRA